MTRSKTAAALNSKSMVVRSAPKPPAVPQAVKWWKGFDEFVMEADDLVEQCTWLREIMRDMTSGGTVPEIESIERDHRLYIDSIESCRESLRVYNRDGDDDARYDDDGDLTSDHVSERLGLMVGSYANARPAEPEVYADMMIKHVLAREPSACELESACRVLVERDKPFIPEISELIAVLRQQQALWRQRKAAIYDIDHLYRKVIEAIPREQAKREGEQKAAAVAEALRKQRRIDDAYSRGLDWVFRAGPIEAYLVNTPREFRWGGADELLISYCMGCFEAASMLREDLNDRVRDGRYARDCEDRRRHWEEVRRHSVALARRSAAKWRMADRVRRTASMAADAAE
jgi:hypothetical protein